MKIIFILKKKSIQKLNQKYIKSLQNIIKLKNIEKYENHIAKNMRDGRYCGPTPLQVVFKVSQ